MLNEKIEGNGQNKAEHFLAEGGIVVALDGFFRQKQNAADGADNQFRLQERKAMPGLFRDDVLRAGDFSQPLLMEFQPYLMVGTVVVDPFD